MNEIANDHFVQLSASDAKRLIKSHHYLLSTPNVVSLSYRDEKKGGEKTGQKALHVGVIKKLNSQDIVKPDVLLPKFVSFETEDKKKVEIRVRVIEEGEIVALAGGTPYKGGSQIIVAMVLKRGTLGVNTQYKEKYCLLSAAHVLTNFNSISNVEWSIFARSDSFDKLANTGATVTGQVPVVLYNSSSEPNPTYAKQDLAWANITEEQGSSEIKGIGKVGPIRNPVLNEKAKFYGGRLEYLFEDLVVEDISASVILKVQVDGETKYGYFEDVAVISLPGPFPVRGDSGAAIIAERDNNIIGILMGRGSIFHAYFCKLTF